MGYTDHRRWECPSRTGLMSDVPDDLVLRGVKHVVQRNLPHIPSTVISPECIAFEPQGISHADHLFKGPVLNRVDGKKL